MSNTILVVGGDKSAFEAAINMRISNPNSEVKIAISDDSFPYLGFGISDLIRMDIQDFEAFKGHLMDCCKKEFGIDILNNHHIISINANEKKVTLSNEKGKLNFQLEYEKLILAPGGTVVYPLIEGRNLKNIFFEERPEQAVDILKHIQDGRVRQVVVVGGSMKGIQTAATLWEMDIDVILVEQGQHLLPGFSAEIGEMVYSHLTEKGLEVIVGEDILTLIGNPMGEVVEVHTPERILPCDLVIWIAQREPNIDFIDEVGLSLNSNGEITINQDLETNIPHIYAIGNCAALNPPCTVASNALISKVFDIYVSKTGFSLEEAINQGYDAQSVLVTTQDNPLCYQSPARITANFIFDSHNGRILGAQFLGETPLEKLTDLLASFIAMETSIEDVIRASSPTSSSRIIAMAAYAIISKLEG